MAILFKVNKSLYNLMKIEEIEYIRKSESFYWKAEKQRDALETTYSKCFETKQEAVDYIGSLVKSRLQTAEVNFDNAKSTLETYNEIYKEFLTK